MPDGELQQQLNRIFALWDDTEERIKEAERLRAEVVIPAIKELRYAGRWLADIIGVLLPHVENGLTLTAEQRLTLSKSLFEAEQNCIRAKNDAVDASVLFIHRRLEQMVQEFGVNIVYSYFPQYAQMRKDIREIDIIITDSRGKERPNRNELYDKIATDHLPKVINLYETMSASEELIQTSIAEKTTADTQHTGTETHRYHVGNIIGIVGGIIGIVGIILAFIALSH